MNIRKLSITLAAILIVGLAGFNLMNSGGSGGEPLKGADELAALGDDRLEGAVLTELGRDTYREGTEPDAWRKMNAYARHLWSVAAIGGIEPTMGLAAWLASIKDGGTTSPGPEEMRDGLEAMGLKDAKLVMDEVLALRDSDDKNRLNALHARLGKALGDKAAVATRQAWVRQHLHDLIRR